MKKQGINYLFIFLLSLLGNSTFAQSKAVEDLKNEIKNLTQQLLAEKEKTAYLKEALDLRSDKVEITNDSVTIKLVEVRGNSVEKTISAKGLITYKGSKKRNLQFAAQQLVDPKGNTTESFTALKTNDLKKDLFIQGAETDIPYAFVTQFKEVEEKAPTLNLLRLQIYGSNPGSVVNFNFKAVDVIWD